jgi:hypothetical protein
MKICKHLIPLLVLSCTLFSSSLSAKIWGKVDAAPVYAHIDVLESGKTVKRMDMIAFKADATVIVWKGVCFKPTVLFGSGQGGLITGGLGIGHCTPITDWLCLIPSVGVNLTHLHTKLKIQMPVSETVVVPVHLKEKFRSISPYICLEASIKLSEKWRFCGQFQYAWSSTRTKLTGIPEFKSHADGPSYSAMIEYDVTDCWSIQCGAAYNITLSKEKHGLRAYGGKLGIAYWF